jgi:hypothetical protein
VWARELRRDENVGIVVLRREKTAWRSENKLYFGEIGDDLYSRIDGVHMTTCIVISYHLRCHNCFGFGFQLVRSGVLV